MPVSPGCTPDERFLEQHLAVHGGRDPGNKCDPDVERARRAGPTSVFAAITEAAGTKFWFHGLRNSFITVAERELLLPRSLTKRLVNHSRGSDATEGYAADWTVEQLREPVQRIAGSIDELMEPI